MALIAVEDGTSEHTGSTVVGPVAGTLTVGSNSFFTIEGKLAMVEDGTMEIPSHQYQLLPPLFHSHSYNPDTLANNYFYIEGKRVILVGDSFSGDATEVKTAGSNSIFEVA